METCHLCGVEMAIPHYGCYPDPLAPMRCWCADCWAHGFEKVAPPTVAAERVGK